MSETYVLHPCSIRDREGNDTGEYGAAGVPDLAPGTRIVIEAQSGKSWPAYISEVLYIGENRETGERFGKYRTMREAEWLNHQASFRSDGAWRPVVEALLDNLEKALVENTPESLRAAIAATRAVLAPPAAKAEAQSGAKANGAKTPPARRSGASGKSWEQAVGQVEQQLKEAADREQAAQAANFGKEQLKTAPAAIKQRLITAAQAAGLVWDRGAGKFLPEQEEVPF